MGKPESAAQGEAYVCELECGEKVLLVKHESGPEIFVHYSHLIKDGAMTLGVSALAAKQVLTLVKEVLRAMRGTPAAKRDKNGRFVGTSIESRTSKYIKVAEQIANTAKTAGKALKRIEDLTAKL